ncbi:hypothetical protein ACFQHV_06545 [Promicromonospora thailandica]|uniref:DUF2637 domain-containing protein n=1 Tax=Promicromonospora thailandica TaxID=765201 RepID=A0A9X2JWA0_9MICO|nr:hypothetical protein [Promicromonospora thailandica]MCP2266400.1 hypothetical protein [Promicromonospora thailandica]BFF20079.1 hypothetical protein GCM10025730_36000 [Promicromonospora thailandica]
MSTNDTTPRGGSRRLVLGGAVSVALISTVSAYLAMVGFGRDVLGMDAATAYTTAGVFELSLVTVALLAREAARDNRPGGTLLTLTWALSSASGVFAAVHEVYLGHPAGAVLFRFVVPLLAALMWHLALIGDRHLASGASWSSMRQSARMHALFLTTEDAVRAHAADDGTPAARRAIVRAEARRRAARAVALRTVPPAEMRTRTVEWLDSLSAVADAVTDVARLHVEANNRVAGFVSAPVMSGPDYEDRAADAVRAELADIVTEADRLSATPAAGQDTTAVRSTVRAAVRPSKPRTVRPTASAGDRAVRLDIVSGLLSTNPDATASDALSALAAEGHHVTDRTARRLLADARPADVATVAAA